MYIGVDYDIFQDRSKCSDKSTKKYEQYGIGTMEFEKQSKHIWCLG